MRVYGPYEKKSKTTTRHRIVIRRPGAKDEVQDFDSAEDARRQLGKLRKTAEATSGVTTAEAVTAYSAYLVERGCRPRSVKRSVERLMMFFDDPDRPVTSLTPRDGEALYSALRTRMTARGKPLAPDSQLNSLNAAKSFVRWMLKRRAIKTDFLESVEAVGRRRRGKPQMTTDEARRWLAKAIQLMELGDIGAGAAATALLLGLRSAEVTSRLVMDLDAGQTLLNITASKTEAGIRRAAVGILGPFLSGLAKGKAPDDLLFGGTPPKTEGRERRRTSKPLEQSKSPDTWLLRHVHRICDLAGVRRVCTHARRGQHSSEAAAYGVTAEAIAAALGHAGTQVTRDHYIRPGALAEAAARRVEDALLPVVTTPAESVTTPLEGPLRAA